MKQHTRQWFRNRIGQTIYRKPLTANDEDGCHCAMCQSDNVFIHDGSNHGNKYLHADYLFLCQNEMGIKYYDKRNML